MDQDTQLSKSERERQERAASARGRKLKKTIIWLVVLLVIAAAVYGLVVWSRSASQDRPGEAVPIMAEITHIAPGQEHPPYNSNPPTSGQHYAVPANWGFYDQKLQDEQLVHNLEHGGVWISYRDEDEALKSEIRELVTEYPLKVIATYRPENETAVAVAAWGRLLKLEGFDREQVGQFIKAFINRGPEQTPF